MLKLSQREVLLAIALAIIGYAFSAKNFLLVLNGLNPLTGFFVYMTIVYVALFVLSKLGLVIFSIRIDDPIKVLGLLLITTAFMITIDWTSPWVQFVTTGSATGASPVFYQCEDGAAWFVWSYLTQDMEVLRLLTYVLTPALLAIVGGLLIRTKARM